VDASHDELESELGDLLFACVNLCRKAGVHSSLALDKANAKFERRFKAIEETVRSRGVDVHSLTLEELDGIWDSIKKTE
jgi:nucleoside triphosphate diphosphatase